MITVLIPAHNERESIKATVESVKTQTLPANRIIVVTDNCSDDTAAIAGGAGATVMASVGNKGKKAGALNQILSRILPDADDDDIFLVMDADGRVSPDFLAIAAGELADSKNGAVGGVFYGKPDKGGLVEAMQIAEYVRYARQVVRKNEQAYVLTGTATAFTACVLRAVASGRVDGTLPSGPGAYYDERTMTEDSYMTFAVKTLGYQTPSPARCWVSTEVMPTWAMLWRQRRRWQLGALENLRSFGFCTKVTWRYSFKQLIAVCELMFFAAYFTSLGMTLASGTFHVMPFWIAIGGIFWLERIVTARKAGPKAMLIASTMVIELGYSFFLKAVNVYSYYQAIRNREISWSLGPGNEKGRLQCTVHPPEVSVLGSLVPERLAPSSPGGMPGGCLWPSSSLRWRRSPP